ncbi:rab11 family-interacting protein 4B-like isoform X2 [Cimex lectularius]|uniref:FIP-RBD domain-containing protein n=1 Tax=Cimex lectularius TaxID=79782 RepID=A0A8I6RD08_CIMLE|nr:rab11 family-interacting protein 4B-like isoform X2 [Cimex lectularius]
MLDMPLALGPEELQGVLQICDPASSGFVSMEYFTQLARDHYDNQVEADKLVNQLDTRGRAFISYAEFCAAVNAILKDSDIQDTSGNEVTKEKKGGTDRMMAPSVGQRAPPTIDDQSNGQVNGEASVSDGESYESYGQMDIYNSSPNQSDGVIRAPNGSTLRRNTWLRSSLKRSSNNHENLPNRRWGSFRQTSGKRVGNAVSSLNRSSSFNSSGRSSACDTADDVYSDVSLEEEVLDLNHKVQMLQEQMSMLADNQTNGDERYTRVKQDNATLQARVLMLEEQIREVELRAQEKLRDEERWHREMVSRMESEKQLQLENCAIRLQSIELENCSLREEANRYRTQAEKLRSEVLRLEEEQSRYEANLAALKEELELVIERERENNQTTRLNQQFAEELNQELECLRLEHKKTLEELELRGSGVSPTTHEQLRSKFSQLREDNRRLQEAHDEMQALLLTKSVEEGRSLLTGHQSLAAELEALSQDEVRIMLKEQQEVNAQLRRYIDGILLNIVDNYPQLLEVKPALP